MFKHSAFIFVALVFFSFVTQYECHGVKAFIMDKIVNPIKSIFPHHHHDHHHNHENSSSNDIEPEIHRKEHGTLDNLGRDIIRQTSRTFKGIKDTFTRTFSRNTKGLDCNKTLSGGKIENFKTTIQAIYPGTKWCGDGNISKSYDDLGKFSTTDSCCREHDLCPQNMDAGTSKYGLMNTGLFTRSHCDCDKNFYNCLKDAHSIVADSIGYTYFTVLGPQCFKEEFLVIDCVETIKGKCVKYVTGQEGDKLYQWFDSPVF